MSSLSKILRIKRHFHKNLLNGESELYPLDSSDDVENLSCNLRGANADCDSMDCNKAKVGSASEQIRILGCGEGNGSGGAETKGVNNSSNGMGTGEGYGRSYGSSDMWGNGNGTGCETPPEEKLLRAIFGVDLWGRWG